MCGIVGYIGQEPAINYLLDSLQVLEYRGYDSTGIAIASQNGSIRLLKAKGKLNNLIKLSAECELKGNYGIGHTRWATQGVPSDVNAHPHTSNANRIAIVHNGIINNYFTLKTELEEKHQIKLVSETDSEVLGHLIDLYQKSGLSVKEAIAQTLQKAKGSYALAVLAEAEPAKIWLACQEAPLIIGLGENSLFCSSDSAALGRYTNRLIRLKDRQLAELSLNGIYQIYDEKLKVVQNPGIKILEQSNFVLDKGDFKHFLLKEIHEQPSIIRNLLNLHLGDDLQIFLPDLDLTKLEGIKRILILGCGTAYYAGMIGKIILESLAEIPTELEFSSELLAKPKLLADPQTLVIAISQSGETADTLLAVKLMTSKGAKLLAITNRPESSLAHLAEGACIFMQAGIEVSVAATKSFTAQLLSLYFLAIRLAEQNIIDSGLGRESTYLQARQDLSWFKTKLRYLPQLMEQTLNRAVSYKQAILPYVGQKAFIFLGRGIHYPIALEGALKLKEITYVQATGYASGEMKHGPIATIDENVPTLSIITPGHLYHKILHNCLEAKTRGAPSLGIISDNDQEAASELNTILRIPDLPFEENFQELNDFFMPFITVLPLQLIAYYLAEHLGKDVDQPRNLAKSVTVE